jgi:anti-anti-sigma factor
VKTTGKVGMLDLAGEIDILTLPRLEASIAEVRARGARHLLFDLSEVSFLSVRAFVTIAEAGLVAESITICHRSTLIPRVFEMLGAGGFTFVSTRLPG